MRIPRLLLVPLCALSILIGCSTASLNETVHTPWGRMAEDNPQARAYNHYLSSVLYDLRGQQDRALQEVEQIPALDPDALTPTLQLVRGYLRQRDFDKALAMAESAVRQQPERANLWIVQGEIYHQLKRYDDAVASFSKAIELNPNDLLGYGALVELQENTNDLVAAIDIYRRLTELSPDAAGLHYQLGINLARIKDEQGARSALIKALELDSNLVRARYLLGVMYLEAGMNSEAATQLTAYLQQRPSDLSAQEALAAAAARTGDHARASELYQAILNGGQGTPKHNLLAMYERLLAGRPAEAEALAPAEGAPYFATLLRAVARQQQSLPFQPLLEGLDATDGDLDEECSSYLNDLLYFFGEKDAGAWLLEKLDGFKGAGIQARSLDIIRGRTLMSLKQPQQAVDTFLPLLATAGADTPWIHYYLAVSYEELDNFEATEEHLTAYLAARPGEPDVLNFLGYLYAEHGVKLDEAETLIGQALTAEPDNPFFLDSLGWVYYQRGKAEEAIDHIQRAIYSMETDDAVLRNHLGDAYKLKGDHERAVAEWERARRLDPTLPGIQEKIDALKK